MSDLKTKKEKRWIYLIFLTISILCSIFFSNPANATAGYLILNTSILFSYPDPHEATTLGTTLLKEGYSLSLDDVYDICCQDRTAVGLTIYKNGDIVKTIKVKTGDYIYYNKTIGGREYAIIESKFDAHFWGTGDNIVRLKPFYQYSDGSNSIEPDFVSINLNPKIREAPSEEWNRWLFKTYGSGRSDIWLIKVAGMKVDTTQSQVIISDNNVIENNISVNNVTENIQTSPGKSIPGFEFFGSLFSILHNIVRAAKHGS